MSLLSLKEICQLKKNGSNKYSCSEIHAPSGQFYFFDENDAKLDLFLFQFGGAGQNWLINTQTENITKRVEFIINGDNQKWAYVKTTNDKSNVAYVFHLFDNDDILNVYIVSQVNDYKNFINKMSDGLYQDKIDKFIRQSEPFLLSNDGLGFQQVNTCYKGKKIKWIKGYEGLYKITPDGNVISYKSPIRPKVLAQIITPDTGYVQVTLTNREGERQIFKVHRLVAQTYCDGYSDDKEVNHIDGNKSNNCFDNLEWVTRQENMKHAAANNLLSSNKLSNNDVLKIRISKALIHNLKPDKIKKIFGLDVTNQTIRSIIKGKTWKEVESIEYCQKIILKLYGNDNQFILG